MLTGFDDGYCFCEMASDIVSALVVQIQYLNDHLCVSFVLCASIC